MSTVNDALYIDMGPPNGLLFEVRKLTGDTWDPTSIATVNVRAMPPSQIAKDLAGNIVDQSAAGFDVEVALATGDLDESGEWRFYLQCIDADDGIVRTICQARTVKSEFGL